MSSGRGSLTSRISSDDVSMNSSNKSFNNEHSKSGSMKSSRSSMGTDSDGNRRGLLDCTPSDDVLLSYNGCISKGKTKQGKVLSSSDTIGSDECSDLETDIDYDHERTLTTVTAEARSREHKERTNSKLKKMPTQSKDTDDEIRKSRSKSSGSDVDEKKKKKIRVVVKRFDVQNVDGDSMASELSEADSEKNKKKKKKKESDLDRSDSDVSEDESATKAHLYGSKNDSKSKGSKEDEKNIDKMDSKKINRWLEKLAKNGSSNGKFTRSASGKLLLVPPKTAGMSGSNRSLLGSDEDYDVDAEDFDSAEFDHESNCGVDLSEPLAAATSMSSSNSGALRKKSSESFNPLHQSTPNTSFCEDTREGMKAEKSEDSGRQGISSSLLERNLRYTDHDNNSSHTTESSKTHMSATRISSDFNSAIPSILRNGEKSRINSTRQTTDSTYSTKTADTIPDNCLKELEALFVDSPPTSPLGESRGPVRGDSSVSCHHRVISAGLSNSDHSRRRLHKSRSNSFRDRSRDSATVASLLGGGIMAGGEGDVSQSRRPGLRGHSSSSSRSLRSKSRTRASSREAHNNQLRRSGSGSYLSVYLNESSDEASKIREKGAEGRRIPVLVQEDAMDDVKAGMAKPRRPSFKLLADGFEPNTTSHIGCGGGISTSSSTTINAINVGKYFAPATSATSLDNVVKEAPKKIHGDQIKSLKLKGALSPARSTSRSRSRSCSRMRSPSGGESASDRQRSNSRPRLATKTYSAAGQRSSTRDA